MELSDDISVLKNLVANLLSKIEEQNQEIAMLKAENADLRHRLNLNSTNSSLPPSKDLYKIKPALPKSVKGKQGGQLGHKGKTLLQVVNPDKIEVLAVATHCPCGCELGQVTSILLQKRQVFDLPVAKLEVTEYQQYGKVCPKCKLQSKSSFPTQISNTVQYGTSVLALCNLLSSSFHLSCQQISQLFSDLYNQPLNAGTVIAANARAYKALETTEDIIKEQLLLVQSVHFDESGVNCSGKTNWIHAACNVLWTYLFIHPKRGLVALQSEQSLIQKFTNWAIHDCWASYFAFTNTKHAICNAHILRELQALIDQNSQWATKMHQLLFKLYHLTDKGKSHIEDLAPHIVEYSQICQLADFEEPPPIKPLRGKSKSSKGRNLLNRLVEHQDSVLAFAKYDYIPFTNNQAERDIRPVKSKIKISGCFRSTDGANHYARIQSFISTARKQQKSVFKELINTYQGANFITLAYQTTK
jgi:transposase